MIPSITRFFCKSTFAHPREPPLADRASRVLRRPPPTIHLSFGGKGSWLTDSPSYRSAEVIPDIVRSLPEACELVGEPGKRRLTRCVVLFLVVAFSHALKASFNSSSDVAAVLERRSDRTVRKKRSIFPLPCGV